MCDVCVVCVCVCVHMTLPLVLHHFGHLRPESRASHEFFSVLCHNSCIVLFAVAEDIAVKVPKLLVTELVHLFVFAHDV